MELKFIWELPDSMSVKEVESYFNKFLDFAEKYDDFKNLDEIKIIEILEALDQLAERQGYTYELLDKKLMQRVENLIFKIWKIENEEIVDIISVIVIKLGLKNVFNYMKNVLKDELPQNIKIIIQETIDEAGEHIEDPYHSLKKFIR
jgi:hypothetical protein